jgi:hypothetical protein
MDERDSFAQADQQVSALRERITRHRDAMERAKQRGHPRRRRKRPSRPWSKAFACSRSGGSKSLRG